MKTRAAVLILGLLASGCRSSNHPVVPASLASNPNTTATITQTMDEPGRWTVETINAADWAVPLGGLVNLKHSEAKAAGLEPHDEPIQVYFHALRHPEHGLFIVDTGVEEAQVEAPDEAAFRGVVAKALPADTLEVHVTTADWLADQPEPLAGVFLTHLHLDHVMGLPDVPVGTPIYLGPGETSERNLSNVFMRKVFRSALEGHDAVREWQFSEDLDGRFAGVVDVFGDASVWAIHAPGHTPGSTAFLVRTAEGPVLLTGDVSHTAWGWEHGVEPGTYSSDKVASAQSFHALRGFAMEHPTLDVRLGHQPANSASAGH
ncbi:MAG: MBL fold metallo-hydrolase [Nannocystales bacterium]